MTDTKTLVEDKLKELQPLYDRMDDTRDRLWENTYELKNPRTNKKIDDAIHVKMPTPKMIHSTVKGYLLAAKWEVTVNGSLTDNQKINIRHFLDDAFLQADDFLANQGKVWLFDWLCDHVTLRSYIGVRWLSQFVNDRFVIDCRPVDMRFTPHDYDTEGLAWVNAISTRTASMFAGEKWAEKVHDFSPDSKTPHEVWDFWNRKVNEIWVDRKKIWEQPNPWGRPPFVITKPTVGTTIEDEGWIAHDAEDIFYLVRELLDEENRIVSIEQTKAMEPVLPAYQEQVDQITNAPANQPPKLGQTQQVKAGQPFLPLQRPDVTTSFQLGREDVNKAITAGGVNDIDLGNVDQRIAALWITTQAEIRRRGLTPRLKALARIYELSARLLLEQSTMALKGNNTIDLGVIGRTRSYSVQQLKDPKTYGVTYELTSRSDAEDAARRSEFLTTKGDLPMRTRLNILGADNPDGIIRELELEQARLADPALDQIEKGMSFIEEADALDDSGDTVKADVRRYEAMVCCDRAIALMNQRETQPQALQPTANMPQPAKEQGNQQVVVRQP